MSSECGGGNLSTEDRSVMPADTGVPSRWEEPLIAGCMVGPTWSTLASTDQGTRLPRASGVCGQSAPGPGGHSGRCVQRPWSSSLGDGAGQEPEEAQHPLSWGQSWTHGIGDSYHVLRPEERHPCLFMFIQGRDAVVSISYCRGHKCSVFPPLKGRC